MSVITVDDRDPRIKYIGNWYERGSPPEYNSTSHGTMSGGAQATFAFTGSYIAVYGTISDQGADPIAPASSYSVDGSTPVLFQAHPIAANMYGQKYFESNLASEDHFLVITVTQNGAYFWLDYLQFIPADTTAPNIGITTSSRAPTASPPTVSTDGSHSSNTVIVGPGLSTVTVQGSLSIVDVPLPTGNSSRPDSSFIAGSTSAAGSSLTVNNTIATTVAAVGAPPTRSAGAQSASGSNISAGTIVGAAIGGVVIVLLSLVLILLLRRRRRRRARLNATRFVTPFVGAEPRSQPEMTGNDHHYSYDRYRISSSRSGHKGSSRTEPTTPSTPSKENDYGGAAVVRPEVSTSIMMPPPPAGYQFVAVYSVNPNDQPPVYEQSSPI